MALAIFVFFMELCEQPYLVHALFFNFSSVLIPIRKRHEVDPSAGLTLRDLQGALWPNTQPVQGSFCLMHHLGPVFCGVAPPFVEKERGREGRALPIFKMLF